MSREEYEKQVKNAEKEIKALLRENGDMPAMDVIRHFHPAPKIPRNVISHALADLSLRGEVVLDGEHILRLT